MAARVAHYENVERELAVALRGGAFKPRTNPYDFQGLMEEGLQILAEAREAYDFRNQRLADIAVMRAQMDG